jgi:hypothetical protein
MSSSNLTRWIEDADARNFLDTTLVGRGRIVTGTRCRHVVETIAKMPSWFRDGAKRVSGRAIGCRPSLR